jgi:Putative transposase
MRYGARPPIALDRLRRLPDGRIAYRIKKLRDGRAKHRVMAPLEFLARLAAIVPPPRYPLLRYAGVLAPRSPWRRDVVPGAPQSTSSPQRPPEKGCGEEPRPKSKSRAEPPMENSGRPSAATPTRKSTPAALRSADVARDAQVAGPWQMLTPNVLSVKHWSRLLGGALYAGSPRMDWASLLRRSFEVDVLACPTCSGRLRVRGEVTDLAMARLMLDSLEMPSVAPRLARARDPTEWLGEPAGV